MKISLITQYYKVNIKAFIISHKLSCIFALEIIQLRKISSIILGLLAETIVEVNGKDFLSL